MRKLRFDLNINSTALYCPNATEFFSKCYIDENIANNYKTLPGIKNSTEIATTSFDNILKASVCDFVAGTQVLSAITVSVDAVSALAQICRFDLEQSFVSQSMAKGSSASFDVQPFMDFYWGELSKEIKAEIDVLRFRGNKTGATSTFLDLTWGYEKILSNQTNVPLNYPGAIGVQNVTLTAVTVSNVLAALDAVYTRMATTKPECLSNTADLRFYVASNVAAAFRRAVAAGNTQAYVTEELALTYLGIKIVVCDGMTASKIIFTHWQNLIFAFDGEGDGSNLKAVNLEETIAEPKLRTRANLKIGFTVVNGPEIVYYN